MKDELVTFVVQGPVDESLTATALKSIRQHFPGSNIILSTWDGQNVTGLEYDRLLKNQDPGAILQDEALHIFDNVNRQIVSTSAGLAEVTTPYVVKTRSDCTFVNGNFLRYLGAPLKPVKGYQVFEERILTANYNVKNHRRIPLVFHPSDIVLGGKTADLRNLFDIPLRSEKETRFAIENFSPLQQTYPGLLSRFTAETYIWISYLRKHRPVSLESSYSQDPNIQRESDKYLVANYHVRSPFELGLRFSKYRWREFKSYTSYTTSEWIDLYNKYSNDSLRRPKVDFQMWYSLFWHLGQRIKEKVGTWTLT